MGYRAFILSHRQLDVNGATRLIFQGRLTSGHRFHWTVTKPGMVFFIDREGVWCPSEAVRKGTGLKDLRGKPVDALYFRTAAELSSARHAFESRGIPTFEADIHPAVRHLMERFIKGGVLFEDEPRHSKNGTFYFVDPAVKPSDAIPQFKMLSIDIECSQQMTLYAIALYGEDVEEVLMLDKDGRNDSRKKEYTAFRTERDLLNAFFRQIKKVDPDVIIGWNLVGFDLRWLWQKCQALGMDFDIGVEGPVKLLAPGTRYNQWIARIPGRAAVDGIHMAKSAFIDTDDYALSTVAKKFLNRGKRIEKEGWEKIREINRLFAEDKPALALYNLEDTRLVYALFQKLKLLDLAVRRFQLTGLPLDRVGGSVAAFDYLYLPLLHRKGYVGDTHAVVRNGEDPAPGGLVLESRPGLYENVAVLDFKSLYPSIIRTFHVDPLAANVVRNLHAVKPEQTPPIALGRVVRGPAGVAFAQDFAILPGIIQRLWEERDHAKKSHDDTLSQAVKIIMNAFYGVLGTPGCRFYEPALAGTITRIGHWILTFSRDFIEKMGYPVIYGDTDSLFVHLDTEGGNVKKVSGAGLAEKLNQYLYEEIEKRFDVRSRLDVEFETLYVRFFMPTIRGAEKGSKKRYAGIIRDTSDQMRILFTGMESSRRDWTQIAKKFQGDIFRLVFEAYGSPALKEKLAALVRNYHGCLYRGEADDELVYTKGISKKLDAYTKTTPPHVRAARMLDRFEGRLVRYVMTREGPEPIQKRSGAPIDYDHYSDKQLTPVADMVLRFLDMSYQSIISNEEQLSLFEVLPR